MEDPLTPPPLPPQHLHITIPQLLNFLYGDEEFYNERHWLVRNTQAAGHCRVVSRDFASEVYTLDPTELYVHIQEYVLSSESSPPHTFYTLWSRQAWRESVEKVRLSKLSSLQRCAVRTTKDDCEYIASCVARKAFGEHEQSKTFALGLLAVAARHDYSVADLLAYIKNLNDQALPWLDLTTEHQHFLTAKTANTP